MRIPLCIGRPGYCNKNARGTFSAGILVIAILVTVALSSCRKATPAQAQRPTAQQPMEVRMESAEERSCEAFVQKFYDWYWNQFADQAEDPKFDQKKLHGYYDALKLNPPVLSPNLTRLMKKDIAASKAAGGDIVNLDFDPFLNSQDPQGKYRVNRATVNAERCEASIEPRHEIAELQRTGSTWVFENFRYSYFSDDGKTKTDPEDDLIHILSR
jgi:hypothetical protein